MSEVQQVSVKTAGCKLPHAHSRIGQIDMRTFECSMSEVHAVSRSSEFGVSREDR